MIILADRGTPWQQLGKESVFCLLRQAGLNCDRQNPFKMGSDFARGGRRGHQPVPGPRHEVCGGSSAVQEPQQRANLQACRLVGHQWCVSEVLWTLCVNFLRLGWSPIKLSIFSHFVLLFYTWEYYWQWNVFASGGITQFGVFLSSHICFEKKKNPAFHSVLPLVRLSPECYKIWINWNEVIQLI